MKKLFLCLLVFSVFSCDSIDSAPKDIVAEQKMVAILSDLQVAESKVKTLRISTDSAKHLFSIYEMKILNEHNVSAEEYLRSYRYYLDNHKLMTRVHQAVLDTLIGREAKASKMPDVLQEESLEPVIELQPDSAL